MRRCAVHRRPPGEGSPDKTVHRTVLSPLLRFSQKGFLASAQILPQRLCLWNPPPFKKGGRKLICCLIFERGAGRAALRRRSVSGYASYRRKTCEMRRNRKTRNSLIFECACCAAFGLPEVYTDTRAAGQKLHSACNRVFKIHLIFECGAGRAALRRRNVSGYASYRRKTCEMRRNRKTRNSLIFECACCAAFGLPEVYADTRVGRLKIAQCVQSEIRCGSHR